jgi:hypothetical protein
MGDGEVKRKKKAGGNSEEKNVRIAKKCMAKVSVVGAAMSCKP